MNNYMDQIKQQFYEVIASISIDELISNKELTPIIDRLTKMLISAANTPTNREEDL